MGTILVMEALLGRIPGSSMQVEMARNITTLPMRMGGLGLRSAVRTAPGAFWASWADALPMLQQRLPRLTGQVVHHFSHPDALGCLGELQESVSRLDRDGFITLPGWEMLRRGVRPRPPLIVEPGEWHHGWQYFSSSSSEHHFSGDGCACPVVCCRPGPFAITLWTMCQSPIATVDHGSQVRMRWFSGFSMPTPCSVSTYRPSAFQSCPHRTDPRVCREAGATVRRNAKLRDMNISVLASGLELNHEEQLAVDITVRSAVTSVRAGTSKRFDS